MRQNSNKTKPSLLEVNIDNFRAIKQAHIKLDGITVVAGDNSSGKSTISKILYYLFKISHYYNDIIEEKLREQLRYIIRILDTLDDDKGFEYKYEFRKLRYTAKNSKEKILAVIQTMKEEINLNIFDERQKFHIHRFIKFLSQDYDISIDFKEEKIFVILEDIVNNIYDEFQKAINDRNKHLFKKKLRTIYSQTILEDFSVKEYGKFIISKENEELATFDFISNAIYIDSPMAVEHRAYTGRWADRNIEIEDFSHWGDLDYYLKQKDEKQLEKIIDTAIYNDIQKIFMSKAVLDGDVVLDSSLDALIFHRNDDKSFRIKDCATGIKSLAVLQTLYKHGWLTNKTLLVLDEPESHLHPQWIVEYARLIVFLNKKVGVTFFISSHSPDMVGAIQEIAEKENNLDTLRFYFAKKQKDDYTYKFIDKDTEVNDIFVSFNNSLKKRDKYGGDD